MKTVKKNPNAQALGKLGGLKGGDARAKALTPEERQAIARAGGLKGGAARWKGHVKKEKKRVSQTPSPLRKSGRP